MRHAPHFPTIADALQRVFFPGTRPRNSSLLGCRSPRSLNPSVLSQRRHATRGLARRHFGPPVSEQGRPKDEQISSYNIRLVDLDGTLQDPEPLEDVLSRMNRKSFFLVQVNNPDDRTEIPVCKIIDKYTVRQSEQAKAKPPKTPEARKKQLEFSWTIDQNDLGHRLRRMRTFLEEGRRVEVELKRKKKTQQVGRKEMEALVSKIREGVASVEGVEEHKEMVWHKIELMVHGRPHDDWKANMFWESKQKNKVKEKGKKRGPEDGEGAEEAED
ncbi:hypothetical protein MMC20_003240 [Loxospora ochrophaea]|nr:hypothetical protein [Loxospora ochrophaea]